MKEIIIQNRDSLGRLDKYLRHLFPQAAGGFLYRMLRKKNITLNNKKADGSERLVEGDVIRIWFSDETFDKLSGNDDASKEFAFLKQLAFRLDILYEEDDILLVNKPAGMLSQKAQPDDISLNEHVRAYLISEGQLSEGSYAQFRPSTMNRLDFGTSGIVLCAKTPVGARMVSEWIREHAIIKENSALVHGSFKDEGRMVSYLKKNTDTNTVSLSQQQIDGTAKVETIFTLQKTFLRFSLVSARLITGKSHQIRSQLKALSHPIVLDAKYGNKTADAPIRKSVSYPGQLLHAGRVVLPDHREIFAPLPRVFDAVIAMDL